MAPTCLRSRTRALRWTPHPTPQDHDDLDETLRHAADVIAELRTGTLMPKVRLRDPQLTATAAAPNLDVAPCRNVTPAPQRRAPPAHHARQSYYELYVDVFDKLALLEMHMQRAVTSGAVTAKDLYERVQRTPAVLTRFYLLVTAGSVCIKAGGVPSKAVLLDLLEMAKGVQAPQRGLFARYYLAQRTKDKLPDDGSPFAGAWRLAARSAAARCAVYVLRERGRGRGGPRRRAITPLPRRHPCPAFSLVVPRCCAQVHRAAA